MLRQTALATHRPSNLATPHRSNPSSKSLMPTLATPYATETLETTFETTFNVQLKNISGALDRETGTSNAMY